MISSGDRNNNAYTMMNVLNAVVTADHSLYALCRYKEAEEHRAKLAALEQRLIEEKAATAAEDTASKSDITKGLSLDDTDTAVGVESGGDGDNGISPVDSVRTEPTQGEATNGHGDATRVVPGEQGLPNRSNGHLLVPVDVSGAVDDDIGGSSAKGYGGSVVIDPKELYTMITNDVGESNISCHILSSQQYAPCHFLYMFITDFYKVWVVDMLLRPHSKTAIGNENCFCAM